MLVANHDQTKNVTIIGYTDESSAIVTPRRVGRPSEASLTILEPPGVSNPSLLTQSHVPRADRAAWGVYSN